MKYRFIFSDGRERNFDALPKFDTLGAGTLYEVLKDGTLFFYYSFLYWL